jgi:hypothetical protein
MAAKHRARIDLENRAIAGAYYGEALARTKRLKPLSEYLLDPSGAPKQATIQTPEDMLAILKEIEAGGAAMKFEFIPNEPAEGKI